MARSEREAESNSPLRQHCARAHLARAAAAATAPRHRQGMKRRGKNERTEGSFHGASRVLLARSGGGGEEAGLDAEISVTQLLANDFQTPPNQQIRIAIILFFSILYCLLAVF